jgi:hypothetical protein
MAWAEPWTPLRIPLLFNLRRDPYERSNITSNTYWDWHLDHVFLLLPASEYAAQLLATFEEFTLAPLILELLGATQCGEQSGKLSWPITLIVLERVAKRVEFVVQ